MATAKRTKASASGATRSTRKTPARSTAAKRTAEPDTIRPAETAAPTTVVVELPLPEDGGVTLKKKELVDLVVARSGVRKRDVKPVIEAALSILGEALSEGRELNLQPLGKLKVTRMKKGGNGQIINARVRQPEEGGSATAGVENTDTVPLAPAAE